jgi:zinc D-Ala-D-Ala carboxypeptidase
MNITHFSLGEFVSSSTAARRGIKNELPYELEHNAWATLAMLEVIRAHLSSVAGKDVPLSITSGYRCVELNRAIGSGDTSDHVQAMAADFRAPAFGKPELIARELAKHVDELNIGQLILEFPGPNAWVHVSVRKPSKMVNRIITISASGTKAGVQ